MKKTYMQPETVETLIHMENMILAGSTKWSDDGERGTGSLNDEEAEGDAFAPRKHFNVWDD